MTEGITELLTLLYGAHRGIDAMFLDVRDWALPEASTTLIAETGADGATRLRWAGGGPYAKPSHSARRVWHQGPDRTRVEVLRGSTVVRVAVRDGTAWWRWDPDDGESEGDVRYGAPLPPMLDMTLLCPARLLNTMWLNVSGEGRRADREVLEATGRPRENPDDRAVSLELAVDREHGTPLRIATIERGACVSTTEVVFVDYSVDLEPATFQFARTRADNHTTSDALRPRRPPGPRSSASRRSIPAPLAILIRPTTVWLTGPAGAGKTTIGYSVDRLLRQLGVTACVLDDAGLQQTLSSDLGLSRDRGEEIRRAASVAALLGDAGVIAIVALESPHAQDRQWARQIHHDAGLSFLEVWVDTPFAIREARRIERLRHPEPKGGSQGAGRPLNGLGLTDADETYEPPTDPELRVEGHGQHPRAIADAIVQMIVSGQRSCVITI